MEETYLSIPLSHGPTAIVASEPDTNGLSHDGDQQLNAQVMIKNLQNMHTHEKSLLPTGARRRMEQEYHHWARLQSRGPHTGGRFKLTALCQGRPGW